MSEKVFEVERVHPSLADETSLLVSLDFTPGSVRLTAFAYGARTPQHRVVSKKSKSIPRFYGTTLVW
jgi:hypothetical protein